MTVHDACLPRLWWLVLGVLLLLTPSRTALAADMGPQPAAEVTPLDVPGARALRTGRTLAASGGLVMASSLCAWPIIASVIGPSPFLAHIIVSGGMIAAPFAAGAILSSVGLAVQGVARRNGVVGPPVGRRNLTLLLVYGPMVLATTAAFVAISSQVEHTPGMLTSGVTLGTVSGLAGLGLVIAGIAGLAGNKRQVTAVPYVREEGAGLALAARF